MGIYQVYDYWFDQGHECYRNKNYADAPANFEKAADFGHTEARFNTGLTYQLGEGMPKNYSQAMYHYLSAANKSNHAQSQNHIGILYRDGLGQAQD